MVWFIYIYTYCKSYAKRFLVPTFIFLIPYLIDVSHRPPSIRSKELHSDSHSNGYGNLCEQKDFPFPWNVSQRVHHCGFHPPPPGRRSCRPTSLTWRPGRSHETPLQVEECQVGHGGSSWFSGVTCPLWHMWSPNVCKSSPTWTWPMWYFRGSLAII